MKLLEVIPIARSIPKETLSYFSMTDVEAGALVKIPLRKKIIPAIVVSSKNVEDVKSEIKNSSFALRKIEKLKSFNFLRKEFIETAQRIADYSIGSTGEVLNLMVPKYFFEIANEFSRDIAYAKSELSSEKYVIQSSDEDRYAHYKSIIREEFAKGLSVFFCLPTIQDIKKATESLKKGIEPYTFILHSGTEKKEVRQTIKKLLDEQHPILILATAPFLSIPKEKIGTIIVDRENSRSYKLQKSPYLDMRNFAETYAKKINAKIIFGDMLLRAETIQRFKDAQLLEIVPLKFRPLTSSSQEIIDMKEGVKIGEKKGFRIFSEKLLNQISENIENNEHMFIFSARRGLSPSTVCADCENIIKCNACGAHTVLHKNSKENFFLCHKCGERRSADERCKNCGSWKLVTLGIGSELVEEKIKELYPEANVFRIDADSSPSHTKALKIAEKFYSSPQSILVGTEMALLYLTEKIENTAVVSMDSFFSIPDFRVNERVLNILLKMRAITNKKLLIQTRDISQKVFEFAVRGNLIDFFKDEIDDRKALRYPPFSTLIRISITGTKQEIILMGEKVSEMIQPYEMDVFPAFIPGGQGKFTMNGIIKITDTTWPDAELVSKLKSLPMNVSVNVDPDSLI